MNLLDKICSALISLFLLLTVYKYFYMAVGVFAKKKTFKKAEKNKRFAYIVAARNEEKVIGKLIESIKLQDYPQELIDIYVICDNCTDNTESVCKQYENVTTIVRNDPTKQRKGYALEYAFPQIDTKKYDGFFIVDADNLLDKNFTTEMNNAFSAGNPVVTCYRNIKNFDANIISSGYGLHFYANNYMFHRARTTLKLGTHLTGTGYLFASSLLEDGKWRFTNLTEDDEFTIYLADKGVKVEFCEDAILYDEQPLDAKTAFFQRVRWARGRLIAWLKNVGLLCKILFKGKNMGFSRYDLFWHYFPVGMATWILGIIYPIVSGLSIFIKTGKIDILPSIMNIASSLIYVALYGLFLSVLAAIRERKMINCRSGKLWLYVVLSPWFLLSDTINNIVALFFDVKWRKVDHNDDRSVLDVYRQS